MGLFGFWKPWEGIAQELLRELWFYMYEFSVRVSRRGNRDRVQFIKIKIMLELPKPKFIFYVQYHKVTQLLRKVILKHISKVSSRILTSPSVLYTTFYLTFMILISLFKEWNKITHSSWSTEEMLTDIVGSSVVSLTPESLNSLGISISFCYMIYSNYPKCILLK